MYIYMYIYNNNNTFVCIYRSRFIRASLREIS